MNLTLTEGAIGDVGVVKAVGSADVYGAPLLRESLLRLDDRGHSRILVDLTECEFLDAPGLGVIVAALKRARAKGGSVTLACGSGPVLGILRITGLTKLFTIFATRADAAAAMSGGTGE